MNVSEIRIGTEVLLSAGSLLVTGSIGLIMDDAIPDGCVCTVVQSNGEVGILSLQFDGAEKPPEAHYAPPGVVSREGIGIKVSITAEEKGL